MAVFFSGPFKVAAYRSFGSMPRGTPKVAMPLGSNGWLFWGWHSWVLIVVKLEPAVYFKDSWEYILTSKMLELALGFLHQNSFLYHTTYLIVHHSSVDSVEPVPMLLIGMHWSSMLYFGKCRLSFHSKWNTASASMTICTFRELGCPESSRFSLKGTNQLFQHFRFCDPTICDFMLIYSYI